MGLPGFLCLTCGKIWMLTKWKVLDSLETTVISHEVEQEKTVK